MNGLAVVFKYTSRFNEAGRLYRSALAITKRTQGPNACAVASILHNLGGLEHSWGRFAKGEPFARRSVAAWPTIEVRRESARRPRSSIAERSTSSVGGVAERISRSDSIWGNWRRSVSRATVRIRPRVCIDAGSGPLELHERCVSVARGAGDADRKGRAGRRGHDARRSEISRESRSLRNDRRSSSS